MQNRVLCLLFCVWSCIICDVIALSSCPSDATVVLQADFTQDQISWNHYWEECVGSGHALLGLRQDWRNHLTNAHNDLGFKRVRFHGLFDDDMTTYSRPDPSQPPTYSFFNIDSVFDFLMSIGMNPYVELSFMPIDMASGNATIFHYKGNITPPKNYTEWADLVITLANHVIDRYGLDEIRTWFFETWNEPNCGFWSGNQEEYFHLLEVTSAALKSVDSLLAVGGPATCQAQWLNATLAFVAENDVALDFVSTHTYPTDFVPLQRDIMKKVLTAARAEVGDDMPLFFSEYNDGLFGNPPLHDTVYASSFAVFTIVDVQGIADIFSWWTFTDIFEEQGFISVPFNGGFGLQTIYGIPKPSYRAFELLHQTGDLQVQLVPYSHPTAGFFVSRNSSTDEVMVLIWNYNIPQAPIQNETICVSLLGMDTTVKYSATLRRIDEDNANPMQTWIDMGSPEYPTEEQVQDMLAASQMQEYSIDYNIGDNEISFTLAVPVLGVAAITFQM